MNDREYEAFVASRAKPGKAVRDFGAIDKDIVHALMGIVGEAGELVDVVKKHLIYNQPLDTDWICEEAGDLEFYMAMLRNALYTVCGMTRDQILEQNVAKLTARYPDGYTDQAAAERADKGGAE